MEMPFLRAGALAAALATANCATLYVNGTTQRIEVTSTPPGAEVFLDGEPVGTTPAEVVVSRRNRDRVIHIEKEGFRRHRRELRRGTSWWILPNAATGVALGLAAGIGLGGEGGVTPWAALLAGLAPMAVDFATGTARTYRPGRIDAALAPARTRRMEVPEHMLRRDPRRSPARRPAPTVAPQP